MKKRVFSIFLALCMAVVLLPTAAMAATTPFSDVPSTHWAASYITEMVGKGAIKGYSDGTFKPSAPVTGLQFCLMLERLYHTETFITPITDDITRIEKKNIYKAPEYFNYNAPLKRFYAAGILEGELPTSDKEIWHDPQTPLPFSDWTSIPANYRGAVAHCNKRGLLTGTQDGSFRPDGIVTRAQATAILTRLTEQFAPDQLSHPIPTNALRLTDANVDSSELWSYCDGVFTIDFTYWGDWRVDSSFNFPNPGYSKLTFTVTTRGTDHSIDVYDSNPAVTVLSDAQTRRAMHLLHDGQAADTTQTYTVDISGAATLRIWVDAGGMSSYSTISDLYLHN